MEDQILWLWVLWHVSWENILWLVDIGAELEVIDFSHISLVEVLSKKQLEEVLLWWNETELLQDPSELLGCNVAALGSVIVLELWLDENSLINNLSSNS